MFQNFPQPEHQLLLLSFICFWLLVKSCAWVIWFKWFEFTLLMSVFFFTPVFFSIRKFCTGLVYAAIFALVFFWAVPVGFISALITLKNIAKVAPWLDAGESFNQYTTQHQHTYSLSSPLYIFHGNDKEKFFNDPKLSCLLNV